MTRRFKCGLVPATEPPKLRFGSYFKAEALPTIPKTYGHYGLIPDKGWGLLANDILSDCTIAGAMHAVMLWNKMSGNRAIFSTLDAEDDYRDACGWIPSNPSTDTGGDIVSVAQYWQKTGMRDMLDRRHQIAAYMSVDPTNLDHVDAAAYLFGAVGLGVQLTSSSENQFLNGQPWDIVSGDTDDEYHYVPLVGRAANRKVVTWGSIQDVTDNWIKRNLKECVAVISAESFISGKTLEGFDMAALQDDLEALGQG